MRRIIILVLVVAAAIILAMAVSPSFAVRLVNVPEQVCAHEKSPKIKEGIFVGTCIVPVPDPRTPSSGP